MGRICVKIESIRLTCDWVDELEGIGLACEDKGEGDKYLPFSMGNL